MEDRGIVRGVALMVVLALVALGCSGAAEDTDAAAPASTSPDPAAVRDDRVAPTGASSQPEPSATSAAVQAEADANQPAGDDGDAAGPPASPGIVAAAVADLAERINVSRDDIDVRLAEQFTWPDNSIGCPIRDRQYFDDPVEGTRVHLFANGELYRYHSGGGRFEPFLCDISLKTEVPIRRIEP